MPNPLSSSDARKQFNCWNNFLHCEISSKVVDVNGLQVEFDQESSPPVSIAPQLHIQIDGTYAVSVFDCAMAITIFAGKGRFTFIASNTLRLGICTVSEIIITFTNSSSNVITCFLFVNNRDSC